MTVSGPRRLERDPRQKKLYVVAGSGLAVLIVAALAVVFVLPPALQNGQISPDRQTPPPQQFAKPAPSQSAPERGRPAPSQPDPLKDQQRKTAEDLLRDVLRKQAELESEGVKTWGEKKLNASYPEALEALADANARFDEAEYEAAARGFRETISMFDTLAASKDERYRLAMAEGNGALASDNAESALSAFRTALALRPDDPQAALGLARAQSLPQVLDLMEQGRRLDLSDDLDGAFKAFSAAATLDAAYLPAQDEKKQDCPPYRGT